MVKYGIKKKKRPNGNMINLAQENDILKSLKTWKKRMDLL